MKNENETDFELNSKQWQTKPNHMKSHVCESVCKQLVNY